MRSEDGTPGGARESRLVNRNVVAGRGRTSMRLEPELWEALAEICEHEDTDIGELIRRIERAAPSGSRTSAVRVYIVRYYREAAAEARHRAGGHASGHTVHGHAGDGPANGSHGAAAAGAVHDR
ncbi:ribbon-helix-helix domain-containing protein [Acidisphaera rubrifaciens]|nr:ribbon-helix-helix domain-containing protein [Acidisphaera rubrifaciens]